MTAQELQDTIRKPAQKLHVEIEDGLTERILSEVRQGRDRLPLLEFALTLLWDKQIDGKLTHAAYEQIGGVEQALTDHAEKVYAGLSEAEQIRVQQIFIQLVRFGEGTEDTRRIATRAEIGEDNWEVVLRLSGASSRLVVSGRDQTLREETVEVVHEALISGWQRLRDWMEDNREFRMWQERLRVAIRQWKISQKDEDALWRGALLVEAEQWLERHPEAISSEEKLWIETCRLCEIQAAQRLTQRLIESSRLKDEFIMTVSHELRTPLTALEGYIELLGAYNDRLLPERRAEFIMKAHRRCDELRLVVENIMDASRLQVDTENFNISQVALAELVRHIMEIFEGVTRQERRSINVAVPVNVYVMGDELRLRQVLLNLVSNALKYSSVDTSVDIWADSNEGEITVHVHDNGLGVPPADRERIFERFVRLERDMNSPIRGTGLGLYISKQLIEGMGGRLWVESTGLPGSGSTFIFTLKRSQPVEKLLNG